MILTARGMIWFAPHKKGWWQYVLAPRTWGSEPWPVVIWCRMRGHPAGVVWFNVGGTEPDMTCKNCGDEI